MDSIFLILYACLESNYISISFLKDWAEKLIEKTTLPRDWLAELLVAQDHEAAKRVLKTCIVDYGLRFDSDYAEVLIGFIFLSYKNGTIKFEQALSEAIDVADAYELNELLDLETEELNQVSLGRVMEKCCKISQKKYHLVTRENLYNQETELFEFSS